MSGRDPQLGSYYRADYGPHLDRFSHHEPGWWNVREYLGREEFADVGWFDVLTAGISARQARIVIGKIARDWPRVVSSNLSYGDSWIRAGFTLNDEDAAEALFLCGVDKTEETRCLRDFNSTAGKQPRGRAEDGWLRPYRLPQRPLCASVWLIRKHDATATCTINLALQAFAAAYFRLKWVA